MSFAIGKWARGAFSGVAAKLSLYLGYVAIGIAVTLGAAAVWFYHQNTELHESVGQLNTKLTDQDATIKQLQSNNAEQDKAIGDLTTMRQTDSLVVSGLLEDYKRINAATSDAKAKIRELEKRNEEVRSYLNTPLPDSVRRVLSGQAEPASADGHEGGARDAAKRADGGM